MIYNPLERVLSSLKGCISLDLNLRGKPLLIYAGRGVSPTGQHIGHLFTWATIKRIMEQVPDSRLVYMLSNDQKYLSKAEIRDFQLPRCLELEKLITNYMKPHTVDVVINTERVGEYYPSALFFAKILKYKTINRLFGITHVNANLSRHFYMPMQLAPVHRYNQQYDLVVVTSLDQKPFFFTLNKLLKKERLNPVSIVYIRELPSTDMTKKMTATVARTAVFLKGKEEDNWQKIKSAKTGFAGGLFTPQQDFCYSSGTLLGLDLPYLNYRNGIGGSLAFKKAYANALNELLKHLT